jgi:hypothetical protein
MSSNSRSRFRTASNIFSRRQSNNPTAIPGTEGLDQEPKNFDPIDCVGVWLGKTKMGSEHCWEATGAVREMFKYLSKEILDQLGGPSEPGDPIVAWSIYMIGKTKATAVPTLLFICSQRAARRFIKVQIEESGILDKYPNIRVGDCSKPPDFEKVTSLESLQDGQGDRIKMLAGSQGDQRKSLLGNEDTDLDVFIHRKHRLLGCRIFGASMWTATAGAFFQMHGRYFITTVNHVFTPQNNPPSVDPDDDESDSEFEFEIRGVEPHTEADSINTDVENSGLNDRPPSLHLSSRDQPSFTGELIKLGEVIFSAKDAGNPGIDFSLIEIDENNARMSGAMIFAGPPSYIDLRRQIATEPADLYVKVVTASNVLEGRMTGTPTFIRCPGGVGFQEVWTVRFNGQLTQGDCGSLVTGLNCDTIYGHIIAGSPISNVAYIVPAAQIFGCLDDYFAQQNPTHHIPTLPQEEKLPNVGHRPKDVENWLPTSSYEREVRQAGCWPQHPAKYPTSRSFERKEPVSGSNLTRKRWNSVVAPWCEESTTGRRHPPALLTPTNCQNENEWTKENIRFKEGRPSPFPVALQDMTSLYEIEVLGMFLRGTSITDVEDGKGEAGTLRAAWLDEESNSILEESEGSRSYNNPLTATGLLHALKAPCFNTEKEHDAEPHVMRRLIHINDLSPGFIHALAAAAPLGEAKALKSAICAHLGFQASIMVKTQSDGLPVFRLEFHLPYFAFRNCPLEQSSDEKKYLGKANAKSRRRTRYRDASFLRLDSTDSSDSDEQGSNENWSLYECHTSVVITGKDNWQWTAYSFADTDSDTQHEHIDSFDSILGLGADNSILRPRDYFLVLLQIRVEEVTEGWKYVVFKLEGSVKQYVGAPDSNPYSISMIIQDG